MKTFTHINQLKAFLKKFKNKNKTIKPLWQVLFGPVQEPEAKKEMIYNAPQSHSVLIEESCVHCGSPIDECTGYKCWIR